MSRRKAWKCQPDSHGNRDTENSTSARVPSFFRACRRTGVAGRLVWPVLRKRANAAAWALRRSGGTTSSPMS